MCHWNLTYWNRLRTVLNTPTQVTCDEKRRVSMGAVDTAAAANEAQLQTQLKAEKGTMTTRHLSAEMMAKASSENALIKFGKSAGRNAECADLLTVTPKANPSPSLSANHQHPFKLPALDLALTFP